MRDRRSKAERTTDRLALIVLLSPLLVTFAILLLDALLTRKGL